MSSSAEKKISADFFSSFFFTALNARGAEISSGGRRPPSSPQDLEVRCAKRILTSSRVKPDGQGALPEVKAMLGLMQCSSA
jgi:hypothetical protein